MKKVLLYLTSLLLDCGNKEALHPPSDQLFFPTAMVYDKTADRLYVSNGNDDLTFDGAH